MLQIYKYFFLLPLLCLMLFPSCALFHSPFPKPSTKEPRYKEEQIAVKDLSKEKVARETPPKETIEQLEKTEEFILAEEVPRPVTKKPVSEKIFPKRVARPEEKPEEPQEEEQFLTLNFDNADIYDVIHTLGELLGINYIIDPRVRGTVNIRTSEKIRKKEILPILEAIFRANNLTAVKEGNIYHIIPSTEAPRRFIMPRVGREKDDLAPSDQILIQIIPLNYIPVKDLINLVKPFLSQGAIVSGYEKENLIIITDFASNIKKVLGIIETLDTNVFKGVQFELFVLKNSKAEDMAKELEQIFGALEVPTKSGRGAGASFIPIPRINAILVISSLPRILSEVDKWIQQLDQVVAEEEISTYVYFVENGTAQDLGEILNQLFEAAKPEERAPSARRGEPRVPGRRRGEQRTPETRRGQQAPAAVGAITAEVKVIPHATTNSLIIRATPRDYRIVRKILKELDIIPRQVVIEAIIAEIRLDQDTQFGVESLFRTDSTTVGSEFVGVGVEIAERVLPGAGFTYNVIRGDVIATLNALATENKVHILSTPKIIASDNKEASIDIGEEVPLVGTEFRDIIQAGAVQTTIERRDTGVILKLTPHINSTGLVTLDLDLEVSEAQPSTVPDAEDISIFQRKAITSLVVQDGQSILIGGLMEDTRSENREEVPFLGRLPLLGFFFRSTKNAIESRELIFLLTPHVVQTLEEAEEVTKEYRDKINILKRMMKKLKKHELFEKVDEGTNYKEG